MADDLLDGIKDVAVRAGSDRSTRKSTNVKGKPLERGLKKDLFRFGGKLVNAILGKIFAKKKKKRPENALDNGGYPKLLDFYVALASNSFNAFKILQTYQYCLSIQFSNVKLPNFFKAIQEDKSVGLKGFEQQQIISLLVRNAQLPNLVTESNVDPILNDLGYSTFTGRGNVIPDSNMFTVGFLSTEYSLHENLFLDWMRETISNQYQYINEPFSKATIRIDFFDQEHKMIVFSYIFENCFPKVIDTINPDYEIDNLMITRNVTFTFDWMWYETNLKNVGKFPDDKDYLSNRREPGLIEGLLGDVFKTVSNEASRRVSEKYKINF